MEYLSFQDVIRSAVSAFSAGAVCGTAVTLLNEILLLLSALFKVPLRAYITCRSQLGFVNTLKNK